MTNASAANVLSISTRTTTKTTVSRTSRTLLSEGRALGGRCGWAGGQTQVQMRRNTERRGGGVAGGVALAGGAVVTPSLPPGAAVVRADARGSGEVDCAVTGTLSSGMRHRFCSGEVGRHTPVHASPAS